MAERPGETTHRRVLAQGSYFLAARLHEAGLHEEAAGLFRQARDEFEKAAAESREDDRLTEGMIELFASCPDPSVRNRTRALELARQGVARLPQKASAWESLGVAEYRGGDCRQAIVAFEKSLSLAPGPNPWAWLYLAMAHWRAGEHETAREWFNRARTWIAGRPSNDRTLIELEAEANRVLGTGRK